MFTPDNRIIKNICAVALALSLSLPTALAQAEAGDATEQPGVMMVLDGSGSMWGQIDGVAKIEIARGVIGDMLESWDANVQLGVMSYGHREKGACSDIETLVNVGPVNKSDVMAKINAISPKGKTPISASVRKAAEALKFTEDKATVILVSDGLETCNADPCALANELEASGVDFTTHVIGFDIAEEEKAGLSCLAENTGGRYFSAQNASELTTALVETVEIVKANPEPPAPAGPQGMRLSAKLCDTCEILDDDMFWWVFETEQDLEGKRKEIDRTGAATEIIELPARDYLVRARYGVTYRDVEVTVNPDELTDVVVNLEAGNFRVNATAMAGGDELKDNMFYWVLSTTTDLEGKRKEIDRSGAAKHIFRLPAGEYLVRARHGVAYTEQVIQIEAGQLTDVTMDMNAGYARINAAMVEGGAPIEKDMFYWVLSTTTDLEGKHKEFDRSGASNHIFRLPAGDYLLRSRHGKSFVDTPITITAGGILDKTIIQNSSRIKVTAVETDGGAPLSNGVFWWVYQPTGDLEGTEKEIDRSGAGEPILTLPAGEFILAVRYGGKITRTPLTVTAGEEKRVQIVLNP